MKTFLKCVLPALLLLLAFCVPTEARWFRARHTETTVTSTTTTDVAPRIPALPILVAPLAPVCDCQNGVCPPSAEEAPFDFIRVQNLLSRHRAKQLDDLTFAGNLKGMLGANRYALITAAIEGNASGKLTTDQLIEAISSVVGRTPNPQRICMAINIANIIGPIVMSMQTPPGHWTPLPVPAFCTQSAVAPVTATVTVRQPLVRHPLFRRHLFPRRR